MVPSPTIASWASSHVPQLFLGTAAFGVASWGLFHFSSGANAGTAQAWGILLSVWGLLLSVVGFGVTLWQLVRTQKATAAVAGAVSKLKSDLTSFDLVMELRTARAVAGEISNHLGEARWQQAARGYDRLRESLQKVASVKSVQSVDEVKNYIVRVLDALEAVSNLEGQLVAHPVPRMSRDLYELDGLLIGIEFTLKEAFGDI